MKKESNTIKSPRIYVGLDVGTTKIATIIGYRNPDGKIEILGNGKADSTGIHHGLIFNINKTVDGIIKSKEYAEARANQEINEVYVGVAGRHINSMEYTHTITRRNGLEEIIRQEEIDNMIEDLENISINPGQSIITVIPQKYVIDNIRETIEPVGELGQVIVGYFQIITGNENEIKKIIRCVESSNLTVKKVVLEPLASGLSCLSEDEKREGSILIDIGGGTTDIAIYLDGNPVYTKVIPIGGNVITKDIAQVCKIPEDLAEKLKTKYGTCIVEKSNSNNYINIPQYYGQESKQISETLLARIINARVQEHILNQIKQEVDASGYAQKLLAGVVLTGGGSMLKNLKELCQFTLQKPTRLGIPEFGFSTPIPTDLKNPMFSTSLGLLKYGILKEESNMVDEEFEEDEDKGDKNSSPKKKISELIQNFLEKIVDDKTS